VLLLLDDGFSYREIRAILYASNDLIADCVRRFRQGGIHETLDGQRLPPPSETDWLPLVQNWVSFFQAHTNIVLLLLSVLPRRPD